jgi:DNA-binding MarR family transcriptional regulator
MSVSARVKQPGFRNLLEQAFVGVLVLSARANQRLNEMCAAHDITHQQYNVLRILRGAHPVGHPRYEIANRLIERAPDVTRLLDRLVRMGLVDRYWSEANRRESIARITPAGLALLATMEPKLKQVQEHILGGVAERDLRQLARICDAALAQG